jgi:hypothetical protein
MDSFKGISLQPSTFHKERHICHVYSDGMSTMYTMRRWSPSNRPVPFSHCHSCFLESELKMDNYRFHEWADMHLILGQARGNGVAAARLYAVERYPYHRLPNPLKFHAIYLRIRETGTVRPSTIDRERPRSVWTIDVEEHILTVRRAQENPCTSCTARIAVWRVLHVISVPNLLSHCVMTASFNNFSSVR